MPEREIIPNSTAQLRFEFSWPDSATGVRHFGPTSGELAVWLGQRLVWGDSSSTATAGEGISGQWIELLEFLGTHWLYLVLEQGYPFNVSPVLPSQLDKELDRRWESVGESQIELEEETAYAFKISHNLAEASPGTVRPDIWLVRNGGLFAIEAKLGAESITEHLPSHEVKRVFAEVGNSIARRLQSATDTRSMAALKAWSNRDSADLYEQTRIATALPDDYLKKTCGQQSFVEVFSDPESAWVEDNVCVDLAYRCKGVIPADTLRGLLDVVRISNTTVSTELQTISEAACKQLATWEATMSRPYQQGHALANWLRKSAADSVGRVEPEQMMAAWKVAVLQYDFATSSLDAIACWAHGRRPSVFWNRSDKHLENEGARRATLAHEICHLLVDRLEAMPLTAVVRGAMERQLEQRANAFAAEFLCPRNEAGAEYRQNANVHRTIDRLTLRFGVSKELAALQLAKSGDVTDRQHQAEIEAFGPPGAYYPWSR